MIKPAENDTSRVEYSRAEIILYVVRHMARQLRMAGYGFDPDFLFTWPGATPA